MPARIRFPTRHIFRVWAGIWADRARHALKRYLRDAYEGMIRAQHLENQTERASCLTLATNARPDRVPAAAGP